MCWLNHFGLGFEEIFNLGMNWLQPDTKICFKLVQACSTLNLLSDARWYIHNGEIEEVFHTVVIVCMRIKKHWLCCLYRVKLSTGLGMR